MTQNIYSSMKICNKIKLKIMWAKYEKVEWIPIKIKIHKNFNMKDQELLNLKIVKIRKNNQN